MMAGRKPKPTALKELQGNPGKRALNRSEPKPTSKRPSAPSFLNGEAKKEWNRMVRLLFALKLVTEVDRAALAAYCQAWARWIEAEAGIRDEGMVITTEKGNLIQSPYVGIANQSMKQMRAFLVEFGMTPSSRSRVSVPTDDSDDPYENFRRAKND
jgi:P27 family predicted phage terminase small subunit